MTFSNLGMTRVGDLSREAILSSIREDQDLSILKDDINKNLFNDKKFCKECITACVFDTQRMDFIEDLIDFLIGEERNHIYEQQESMRQLYLSRLSKMTKLILKALKFHNSRELVRSNLIKLTSGAYQALSDATEQSFSEPSYVDVLYVFS